MVDSPTDTKSGCKIVDDWDSKAEAAMPIKKKLVSFRIDSDVLEWFQKQGPGYQTRINAVLRSYMEHFKETNEQNSREVK